MLGGAVVGAAYILVTNVDAVLSGLGSGYLRPMLGAVALMVGGAVPAAAVAAAFGCGMVRHKIQ